LLKKAVAGGWSAGGGRKTRRAGGGGTWQEPWLGLKKLSGKLWGGGGRVQPT